MKIGKHENIAMLAVSSINIISIVISKAFLDVSISDEEYSLILLELETYKRMKENLRNKSKMSFEKTGNIETEANDLLRRKKICVPTWEHVQNHAQNYAQNRVVSHALNRVRKPCSKIINYT